MGLSHAQITKWQAEDADHLADATNQRVTAGQPVEGDLRRDGDVVDLHSRHTPGTDNARVTYPDQRDVREHRAFPTAMTTSQYNLAAIAAGRPDLVER